MRTGSPSVDRPNRRASRHGPCRDRVPTADLRAGCPPPPRARGPRRSVPGSAARRCGVARVLRHRRPCHRLRGCRGRLSTAWPTRMRSTGTSPAGALSMKTTAAQQVGATSMKATNVRLTMSNRRPTGRHTRRRQGTQRLRPHPMSLPTPRPDRWLWRSSRRFLSFTNPACDDGAAMSRGRPTSRETSWAGNLRPTWRHPRQFDEVDFRAVRQSAGRRDDGRLPQTADQPMSPVVTIAAWTIRVRHLANVGRVPFHDAKSSNMPFPQRFS